MSLNMTRAEREVFLMDLHVGVISIDLPGAAPLSAQVVPLARNRTTRVASEAAK